MLHVGSAPYLISILIAGSALDHHGFFPLQRAASIFPHSDGAFGAEHAEFGGSSTGPSAPGPRRSAAVRSDAKARGAAPGQRGQERLRGTEAEGRRTPLPHSGPKLPSVRPSVRPLQFPYDPSTAPRRGARPLRGLRSRR